MTLETQPAETSPTWIWTPAASVVTRFMATRYDASVDEIVTATGLDASAINTTLGMLEEANVAVHTGERYALHRSRVISLMHSMAGDLDVLPNREKR